MGYVPKGISRAADSKLGKLCETSVKPPETDHEPTPIEYKEATALDCGYLQSTKLLELRSSREQEQNIGSRQLGKNEFAATAQRNVFDE